MTIKKYEKLKPLAYNLLKEILEISAQQRVISDSGEKYEVANEDYPRLGIHYYSQNVEKLAPFINLTKSLINYPNVSKRFDRRGIESLIFTFVTSVFATSKPFDISSKSIDFFWGKMCALFGKKNVIVRTVFGLKDFSSDRKKIKIDNKTTIYYFQNSSLDQEINRFFQVWDVNGLSASLISKGGHHCKGVVVFDVVVSANISNLQYHNPDSTEKMVLLSEALNLATFGSITNNPWITVWNPEFPLDSPLVISGNNESTFINKPKLFLDSKAIARLKTAFKLLETLAIETKIDFEKNRKVRNRFNLVLQKTFQIVNEEFKEISVVNLAVVFEALFSTSNGSTQVALAAANLLGKTSSEQQEVFENIKLLYSIRNMYVHGDPISDESWNKFIFGATANLPIEVEREEWNLRPFAFEILLDYANRSMLSLLNIYYSDDYEHLKRYVSQLSKLHLTPLAQKEIQSKGKIYPLASRKFN